MSWCVSSNVCQQGFLTPCLACPHSYSILTLYSCAVKISSQAKLTENYHKHEVSPTPVVVGCRLPSLKKNTDESAALIEGCDWAEATFDQSNAVYKRLFYLRMFQGPHNGCKRENVILPTLFESRNRLLSRTYHRQFKLHSKRTRNLLIISLRQSPY